MQQSSRSGIYRLRPSAASTLSSSSPPISMYNVMSC